MKIALCNFREFNPMIGGIERVSVSLAQSFIDLGYEVLFISCLKDEVYGGDYTLPAKQYFLPISQDYSYDNVLAFVKIVQDEDVRIIINQNCHSLLFNYMCTEVKSKSQIILISAFHFCPDYAEKCNTDRICWSFYPILDNVLYLVRSALFRSKLKKLLLRKHSQVYQSFYDCSDCTVLLSNEFKEPFLRIAQRQDSKKLAYIGNMLSFPYDEHNYHKDNRILFCCRLENQKNPYRALLVWEQICDILYDWQLDIVGDGSLFSLCKRFVDKHNLKRVNLFGFSDPIEFYKRSKIFWMTSNYEGWGLTLTESMQFGCVPIAFESYSSVTDIITNGVNGYLIPPFNLSYFGEKTCELAFSPDYSKISLAAKHSTKRFLPCEIAKKWRNLFDTLDSQR